jgi:hypothetical protein
MMGSPIDVYRRQIERELKQGDATEHTHRPALKALIESLAPGVTATNEPKRVACGAPDFSLSRKKVPLGHIETKDVGVNLAEMERGKGPHGEQFTRYRDGLPNWILTDYLEFRWYVAGQKRLDARLAEFDLKGKLKPTPHGEEKLAQLLEAFIKQEALTVSTAKDLAQRMAGMTRIVRDLIIRTFEHEGVGEGSALPKERGWLHNWLAAFREVLLPDLDEKQFADMFAQTLAYGLFAAKVHSGSGKAFSREMAAFNLPKTNPFLRKLFSEIAGVDMPDTIDWAVDDIVELLKHADLTEILKDFGKGQGKEDPVVHFYETFLTAYDPKMRELRGVYYTPEPVVSYIVRSIDHLLKTRFNRPKGLADENTLTLDPACGTGTFLYFVIQQIYQRFAAQKGAWDGYVAQHLLNRLFGFELLMAPYAVAHLKLGMELQETGYSFGSDQRLGIYLTNTLEEAAKKSEKLFAQWISDEANAAASIKRDLPIMVVMGNPPYSGHSANRSWELDNRGKKVPNFIGRLLQDYYKVDGQPLGERNPKWLQDDYVKFLRFGQWRIERTGAGILAFITNHGYLDNPTFRGMRQQLMEAFTDIYILNLHGSTKKKERAPDGSKDENVFDIQQGVTLGIFVREPGKAGPAKVFHADLWGLRETKYERLWASDIASSQWTQLDPKSPFYMFVPQAAGLRAEYEGGWKITDAIPVNNTGMVSKRDSLAFQHDKDAVLEVVKDIYSLNTTEIVAKYPLSSWSSRDGKPDFVKKSVMEFGVDKSRLIQALYRPFDLRWTYYTPKSKGFIAWPVYDVMRHMLTGKNLGIIVPRRVETAGAWCHAFTSRRIVDHVAVSLKTIDSIFPLYLYPTTEWSTLSHWPAGLDARWPNLDPAFVSEIEKRLSFSFVPDGRGDLKKTFGPEDIFEYIYAVLHSPTYRKRYAEFLKIDFPRVPLTSDATLFRALCEKGAELVALHLLESPALENPVTCYPVKGSNVVEKGFPKYVAPGEPEPGTGTPLKAGRVYINSAVAAVYDRRRAVAPVSPPATGDEDIAATRGQYFEGVPPEVWNFHIGGYQVCEKWLKDRRGRTLSFDDLTHYQKIIAALKETMRLMAEIDAAIPRWPLE